ncbi:uncharacterized protein LOC5517826 [Nematostella vectensis]|uniref:uncharacterized protein LOC5517826 n=1 Tax=Nematostella vectensis TaxID=45351 RepID=UPI0020778D45|nr:uncharacterized protein LOC5517826 [Nematostella vectensis]
MPLTCLHCKSGAVGYDEEEDVMVCGTCGTISEEGKRRAFQHDPVPWVSPNLKFSANSDWRYKHHHAELLGKERKVKKIMSDEGCKLNLPPRIIDETMKFILQTVYRAELDLHRRIRPLVFASIYIVARQNRVSLSLRNIAHVADMDVFRIGHVVKFICSSLNIELQQTNAHDYLSVLVKDFEVLGAREVENLATSLLDFLGDLCLAHGRNPVTLAYVSVFLSVESKYARPSKKIHDKICLMHAISGTTAKGFLQKIRRELCHIVKESLPWIGPVRPRDVAKFIPDVIQYKSLITYEPRTFSGRKRREKIRAERQVILDRVKDRIKRKEIFSQVNASVTRQASTEILSDNKTVSNVSQPFFKEKEGISNSVTEIALPELSMSDETLGKISSSSSTAVNNDARSAENQKATTDKSGCNPDQLKNEGVESSTSTKLQEEGACLLQTLPQRQVSSEMHGHTKEQKKATSKRPATDVGKASSQAKKTKPEQPKMSSKLLRLKQKYELSKSKHAKGSTVALRKISKQEKAETPFATTPIKIPGAPKDKELSCTEDKEDKDLSNTEEAGHMFGSSIDEKMIEFLVSCGVEDNKILVGNLESLFIHHQPLMTGCDLDREDLDDDDIPESEMSNYIRNDKDLKKHKLISAHASKLL